MTTTTHRLITLILLTSAAICASLALVLGNWFDALGWLSAFFGWHTVYRMERIFP
jgi:hypothetical protein